MLKLVEKKKEIIGRKNNVMTYIIHVRYGARSNELKNTTEVVVKPKKELEEVIKDIKEKFAKKLDVPFPIVDIWKISKM